MASDLPFPLGFLHQRLDSGHVLSECLFHPDLSRLAANRERAVDALRRNLEDILPQLAAGRAVPPPARHDGDAPLGRPDARPAAEARSLARPGQAAVPGRRLGARAGGGAGPRARPWTSRSSPRTWPNWTSSWRRRSSPPCGARGTSKDLASLAWVQRTLKFKVEWQTLDVKLPSLKQRAQREEDESGEEKPSVLKQVATLLDPDRLAPALGDRRDGRADRRRPDRHPPAERAARRPERGRQDGRGPRAGPPAGRLPPGGDAVLPDERGPDRGRPVRLRHVAGALHGPRPRVREEAGRPAPGQPGRADGGRQERVQPDGPRRVPAPGHRPRRTAVRRRMHARATPADRARGPAAGRRVPAAHGRGAGRPPRPDHPRPLRQRRPQGRPRRCRRRPSTPSTGCTAATPPTRPTPAGRCGSWRTCAATATARCRPRPPTCSPPSPARPACRASCSTRTCRSTSGKTRDWFAGRVIGQPEAVDLVVDLLATVKAGLTRPNRPIASLLFIGPTGRRQDGDGEGAGRVPVRLEGPADPVRHERVRRPGGRRPAGRVGVRRRGAAHGQGPRAAVLRAACSTSSRRPTRRSSTCCCRCSARPG